MPRLAVIDNAGRLLDDSVARAKAAESMGYESVWVTQLPDARDAALVLAAYGAATHRVTLGTGVLPIYTRHPTAMAQMAAALDEVTGGRFILGLGISHKATVEGMWGLRIEAPVEAMREYFTIVRTTIRDGSCAVDGKFFSARWAYSAPRRPAMSLMISALSPRMLELSGEIADGVVLWMCSAGYVRDQVIPHVKAGREKAGKTLEGFEIVAAVPALLTTDPAGARGFFRQIVSRYGSLPYYRKMMDASGFQSQLESGEISDAMLDELAGIGDADQVREVVRRYREAGVTLPAVYPFAGHKGAATFEQTLEAAISG